MKKPLSVDLETPQYILSRLQEQAVITSVGYHFRYRDSVRMLKTGIAGKTPSAW
ncbi:hypothetical protein GCM10020331_069780 [Ectobacillus funiculus]